jgi:hypothetical protein
MDGGKPEFSCDMVIAMYKEPLTWLKNYEKKEYNFRNIFLYNKNHEANNKTSQELHCSMKGKECVKINLLNEGRCDHTYLYHIIHHYDTLADVTIFTKGSSDLQRERAKLNFITKKVFETKRSVFSVDRLPTYVNIALKDFKMNSYTASHPKNRKEGIINIFDNMLKPAEPRTFGEWYDKNFPNVKILDVSYAAVMAISRKDIHKYNKSHYTNLIKQLEGHPNPEVGHYFERAWLAVFFPIPENCIYVGGGFTLHGGRRRRKSREIQHPRRKTKKTRRDLKNF